MLIIGKKAYNALLNEIKTLKEEVEGKEFDKLRKDSEELKEKNKLIESVRFKVRSAAEIEDQTTGGRAVKIIYQPRTVILRFDEKGNPIKDDFFYALNSLGFVSVEDMARIQSVIDKE